MNRVVVDPVTDPMWKALVDGRATDVFHSPQWLRVLAETYGFEPRAVVLTDGDSRPIAGLPYCVIDGVPAKRIATPPFSDFCDPIVAGLDELHQVIEPLFDENCRLTIRCLHNETVLDSDRLDLASRAKWHGLDLDPHLDDLWMGFLGPARRAVRKAQKEDVVVREASGPEDLRAFFNLHLGIRKRKYRLLAQPYRFFENVWQEFVAVGNGTLLLATHDDRIISSGFFLEWQGTMYYKFTASDPAYAAARPNDLVIWRAIQLAKDKKLDRLDFGLSDWDQEGLIRFKRKYASEEKTISFLRNESSNGRGAAADQAAELLPRLTELFTDDSVPDAITEAAGDTLYGFFA